MIGSLVDAAGRAREDRANRPQLARALDAAGQAEALAALPLTILLGIGDRRIVAHDAPLDPRVAERSRARHADSRSLCYSELVVTRLAFRRSAPAGRMLHAAFLYRDFSAAAAPHFTYAGRTETRLHIFPPAHEGEIAAARAELERAFRYGFRTFARDMVAARSRRLQRESRRRGASR